MDLDLLGRAITEAFDNIGIGSEPGSVNLIKTIAYRDKKGNNCIIETRNVTETVDRIEQDGGTIREIHAK